MEKASIYSTVTRKAPLLKALSDQIWEFAELSMAERKSADAYCKLLAREGFRVETNLCGIPTAFSGSFGSGNGISIIKHLPFSVLATVVIA